MHSSISRPADTESLHLSFCCFKEQTSWRTCPFTPMNSKLSPVRRSTGSETSDFASSLCRKECFMMTVRGSDLLHLSLSLYFTLFALHFLSAADKKSDCLEGTFYSFSRPLHQPGGLTTPSSTRKETVLVFPSASSLLPCVPLCPSLISSLSGRPSLFPEHSLHN